MPEHFKRFFGDDFAERFGFTPDSGPDHDMPRGGIGSGFVVDADGYVVTSNHVIDGAETVTVILDDGTRLDAEIVGGDRRSDIALLKVESDEPLPTVRFAADDGTRVGDWVVAIGNPFGVGKTVTFGIVSARGRTTGTSPYADHLQIDAPINRGNSGGPAVNLQGEVIGVNTAIFSPNGGSVGIGFAVPAALAGDIVAELKVSGAVERGRLGVRIQHVGDDLAAGLGLDKAEGALVASVDPSGPAAGAGVEPGDVILEVDGERVGEMRRLPRMIAERDPGETVALKLWRNGAEAGAEVTLAAMPASERVAEAGAPAGSFAGLDLGKADGKVVVADVAPGSPAARKGVKKGDVLLSVDRRAVETPGDVDGIVAELRDAGRKAVVMLLRRENRDRFVALPLDTA
jgi:serine protease Do